MNRNWYFPGVVAWSMAVITFLAAADWPALAEWKESVLYSFQGIPDGATPAGGVVFGKDGNLYGATTDGGADACAPTQCGTVFQLARPAKQGEPWTETVIHIFQGNTNGDGNTPAGGVIFDHAGNLYGTTAYGGSGNCVLLGTKTGCGTVYEILPPTEKGGAWTEKVLYSFKGGKDGQLPQGDLVFDSAGNLYGVVAGGGRGTTDRRRSCGAGDLGTGSCEEIAFSCDHERGTGYLKRFVLPISLASTPFLSLPTDDPMQAIVAVPVLG